MITTKHGSIFDSTADVLVCPVNCVGVMGKGLALEFKKRFPQECVTYFRVCISNQLTQGQVLPEGRVRFAATKNHWRDPSQIHWVEDCLWDIAHELYHDPKKSIAIPQLGCGCGGLEWADVWPLYEKHLGDLAATVEVWIYE